MRIASAQPNFRYGDQTHYPYSIGCLLSYAKTQHANLDIQPCFVLREHLYDYIERASQCDLLLVSNYVWNWSINVELAREVKGRNPQLRVVFGGPQVPNDPTGFFDTYPFVDVLVHSEGELSASSVIGGALSGPGITTRDHCSQPPQRLGDLMSLPSPYLDGTIDQLTSNITGIRWVATWETNRGCPYSCTFL